VSKYSGAGVDDFIRDKAERSVYLQEAFRDLAENHSKTIDSDQNALHEEAFNKSGQKVLDHNYQESELEYSKKLKNRKKAHYAQIGNTILAFVDAMESKYGKKEGVPIILLGIPTFSGSMPGLRPSAPKKVVEITARHFCVIMIDEYLTSQLCPCCNKFLIQVSTKSKRIWRCDSCTVPVPGDPSRVKPLIVNKDVSASLNFFTIFACLLWTGTRPNVFMPKRSKTNRGEI
jgi:ribosomal protein L37AE/L43A